MDDKLREMARQALADTDADPGAGNRKVRAMKLCRDADGARHTLAEYAAAVDWAMAHPAAADLPNDSVVARTHVAYIRSGAIWYSTNGTTHTDEDIDRFLLESRTRVLRVGAGTGF